MNKKTITVFTTLVGVVSIAAGVIVSTNPNGIFKKETITSSASTNLAKEKYEIDFPYEVAKITGSEITLNGKEGLMVLPLSSSEVFIGSPLQNRQASLSDLTVGQNVTLEIIPGEKVWIYIQE
jgi:hypothetical protein